VFFVASKVLGWLVHPLHALILLQAFALILLALRWRRTAAALFAFVTLAFAVIGWSSLADALLHGLEHSQQRAELPARLDGIVVLGGAEYTELSAAYGMAHMNDDSERVSAFVGLARQHPEAKLVFTGGSGELFGSTTPEAEVVKLFFREQGLDTGRLLVEDRSRNTYENALFSKALVQPKPGERWLLVTSAFHMPRAVAVFRAAGWEVLPWPVAYRTLPQLSLLADSDSIHQFDKLNRGIHEWLGLLAYRMTGKL
jgi:uncharacterized SAM-binding protein YcdF (DUF218 family)